MIKCLSGLYFHVTYTNGLFFDCQTRNDIKGSKFVICPIQMPRRFPIRDTWLLSMKVRELMFFKFQLLHEGNDTR